MRLTATCVLLALLVLPAASPGPAAEPGGWEDLFPGKDLAGWKRFVLPGEKPSPRNPWSVDSETRVLRCDGVGIKELFVHEKERGDGIFHVEWRVVEAGKDGDYNGGVYVRTALDGKVWHQAQVAMQAKPPLAGDLFGDTLADGKVAKFQALGTGHKHLRPLGEWNTFEVACKGKTVTVSVNGAEATRWTECGVPRGHVGLQAEFFRLEFRNLKFKESK